MSEPIIQIQHLNKTFGAGPTAVHALEDINLAILEYLMRHPGTVLSREQIEDQIWNYEYAGSSNNVDGYLSRLRKKIDEGRGEKLLHTVRGMGWAIRPPAGGKAP